MKFFKEKVIYVGSNQFKSKDGKDLCFVKIADSLTFENLEVMPFSGLDIDSLVVGQVYRAELECQGRYSNLNLLPAKD